MKRKNIIKILWLLWIVSIIGMVFGVYIYIEHKRARLRSEIRENIEKIFEGQSSGDLLVSNYDGFFDVEYSGRPVRHYKKIAIPLKPSKKGKTLPSNLDLNDDERKLLEQIVEEADERLKNNLNDDQRKHLEQIEEKADERWENNYGDLASLYELNWGDSFWNPEDKGWSIIRIYCGGDDDDFIQTNCIFPYKVGLKKAEWGNFYTVEQAVNEAFEFYSTNPESRMADRFRKGVKNRLWSEIYNYSNEFFWIVENKNLNSWNAGIPIYKPEGKSYDEAQRTMPYENGWMQNRYYRVFIAATQERHYKIQEKVWVVNGNRNKLLFWWGLCLTVLFLSRIIPLTIKEKLMNKRKSETLYQRLCRMCNPSNFMKDYNKDKVDKANDIYQRLMEIKPDDKVALMSLQAEAVSSLGIVLIDGEELKELIEKVNPQRFMNPYNAEKVKMANDLYSRLIKENLTYEEFTQIVEDSKTL